MGECEIETTSVRATASQAEQAAALLAGSTTGASADPGHAALATAIAGFADRAAKNWDNNRANVAAIAPNLTGIADLYEDADRVEGGVMRVASSTTGQATPSIAASVRGM